jgi:hypothetical protein
MRKELPFSVWSATKSQLQTFRIDLEAFLPHQRAESQRASRLGLSQHPNDLFLADLENEKNEDGFHFSVVLRLTGEGGCGAVMVAVNFVASFALLPP